MKLWKRNPSMEEPAKDPEIQGWFQTLGAPPVEQGSPYLRAKVRARIAQEQAQPKVIAWGARLGMPTWTAVLATGLIFSVGVQVWRGFSPGGPSLPGTQQVGHTSPDNLSATGRVPIYQFQVRLQQVHTLGTLVATQAIPREPTTVGFTPQAAPTTFVRIGLVFAEALATLRAGMVDAAAPRLDVLVQMLVAVQAPRTLAQYPRAVQTLLQTRQYTEEDLATFLALFEPLYEDMYVRTNAVEAVRLFRVGAWVENVYLAAAVGDPGALQQEGQTVEEVHRALTTLHAPRETLEALAQMRHLLTQPALSSKDVGTIQTLAQRVQEVLNE